MGILDDPLRRFSTCHMDTATAGTTYTGFIANNGDWYILRGVTVSSETTYRYAEGKESTAGYDTAWAARASQYYQRFDKLKLLKT